MYQPIKVLHDINWRGIKEPKDVLILMYLFLIKEIMSSKSLKVMGKTYNMDPVLGPILKQIFSKEMETDNLKFADYDQTSDHSTFLVFFLRQAFAVPKEGFYPLEFDEKKVSIPLNKDIINIGKGYYQSVLDMGPTQIMGSVMYMEEKLVPMYCNMLQMDVFKMNNPPKYVVAFKKFIHVHVETYRRSMGSDPDLISAMDPITYSFEEQYEFLFGMFQKAFPELISEYV